MNKWIGMGRLTKNPDIRYTQGENSMCVARYTLAVDRRGREKETDFIPCVAWEKAAEFAERYLTKGMKITVSGRITTGSYTNRDGVKVYTTEITIEEQEFAESRQQTQPAQPTYQETQQDLGEGWMGVPEDTDDGGLPWN